MLSGFVMLSAEGLTCKGWGNVSNTQVWNQWNLCDFIKMYLIQSFIKWEW